MARMGPFLENLYDVIFQPAAAMRRIAGERLAGQALAGWVLVSAPAVALMTPILTHMFRRIPAVASAEIGD